MRREYQASRYASPNQSSTHTFPNKNRKGGNPVGRWRRRTGQPALARVSHDHGHHHQQHHPAGGVSMSTHLMERGTIYTLGYSAQDAAAQLERYMREAHTLLVDVRLRP